MRIDELIERVQGLTGPDREVDCEIAWHTGWDKEGRVGGMWRDAYPHWRGDGCRTRDAANNWKVPRYTASLDAAVALVKRVLPGWGYRVATCCVSDDAWLFPDYNDPVHGERLKREVSEDIDWIEVTDIDLRPPGREPIALVLSLLAALQALKAKEARDGR